ncbi:MAG TPA: hypothetical protein VFZ61_33080 [Polyangiales bacterium]
MRTPYRLALLLSLVACSGTDVGNPPRGGITDFNTTACKRADSDKGLEPLPTWQPDPEVYRGLTCVLWETEGDVLRVRLTNHEAGCHENEGWKPRAELDDSRVDLILDNPKCVAAGCGNCIYDVAFDVRLGPAQRDAAALSLRILGDDCSGEAPVHHTLELAGAARSSGARCSYTYEHGYDAFDHGSVGQLNSSCGMLDEPQPVACERGVCTPINDRNSLCLAACTTDADCQPAGLMACVDGVCRLR